MVGGGDTESGNDGRGNRLSGGSLRVQEHRSEEEHDGEQGRGFRNRTGGEFLNFVRVTGHERVAQPSHTEHADDGDHTALEDGRVSDLADFDVAGHRDEHTDDEHEAHDGGVTADDDVFNQTNSRRNGGGIEHHEDNADEEDENGALGKRLEFRVGGADGSLDEALGEAFLVDRVLAEVHLGDERHDEGGQLTEAVRRRPYSVVLFDEIEKAHPDIQNILLQILEDGQLTDAMGRKADFRNTIVLITSNLGARFLAGQSAPLGFAAGSEAVFEKQAAQAVEEAKKWFRPELVGRLDELIVFRPLSDESMSAIAEKMLCRLEVRAARSGYQLRHTPQVGAVLAARARSAYGARELRRQVDRAVEQALADQIAAGTACTGQHWTADCTAEGTIVLRQDETATL